MVGERLKRFRLARGMALDDLEAAIGELVSKQTLSKYERGKMRAKVTTLNQIAAALGIKFAQLWGEPNQVVMSSGLLIPISSRMLGNGIGSPIAWVRKNRSSYRVLLLKC